MNARQVRVPPHNLGAEESLLGAMMLSRDAIATAVEAVTANAFYKPAHAHIFDAITNLYGSGQPADPITVAEELRRAGVLDGIGGASTLVDLQAATPSIGNAARYAKIVEDSGEVLPAPVFDERCRARAERWLDAHPARAADTTENGGSPNYPQGGE